MTVTQCFKRADLIFYNDIITEENIQKLVQELNTVLSNNKYNCVHNIENQEEYVSISLYLDGEPYYECECDYTPGYPAKITGDPYYCYPGASGDIDCYDSIVDVLHEIWDNKDGWTYEVDDEELDSEKYLWELLADD